MRRVSEDFCKHFICASCVVFSDESNPAKAEPEV